MKENSARDVRRGDIRGGMSFQESTRQVGDRTDWKRMFCEWKLLQDEAFLKGAMEIMEMLRCNIIFYS